MKTIRRNLKADLLLLSFAFLIFSLCSTLAHALEFSALLQRGTDRNAMAFNSQGDVYFIGWEAGLERTLASNLPNDENFQPDVLIPKEKYNQIFEPSTRMILDINGVGIGFDSQGNVISFLEEVYKYEEPEVSRVRFVRYYPSSSYFDGLQLFAGQAFSELELAQNESFKLDGRKHVPLQMVVTQVNGAETILFTLKDVPVVFQAPVTGGNVTTFYRFQEVGYPWSLTVMEHQGQRSLIASHSNGNIYQVNLESSSPSASILVAKSALLGFFGESETHWNIDFVDLDYEPISDRIYVSAFVPWHTPEIPRTLIAITPDGATLEKVFDVNGLTTALEGIRTPENGNVLQWNTVVVNPVAVAAGQASLFIGDYWSGLKMVRVDLSPAPLTPAEQMFNILNYFDESVAAGTIYTSDYWSRPGRYKDFYRDILRSTIAFAYVILDRGYLEGPTGQYWRYYLCSFSIPYLLWNTDGVGRDYITGLGVPQLHTMIEDVRVSIGCN